MRLFVDPILIKAVVTSWSIVNVIIENSTTFASFFISIDLKNKVQK